MRREINPRGAVVAASQGAAVGRGGIAVGGRVVDAALLGARRGRRQRGRLRGRPRIRGPAVARLGPVRAARPTAAALQLLPRVALEQLLKLHVHAARAKVIERIAAGGVVAQRAESVAARVAVAVAKRYWVWRHGDLRRRRRRGGRQAAHAASHGAQLTVQLRHRHQRPTHVIVIVTIIITIIYCTTVTRVSRAQFAVG